jgi:hypothetical protein
MECWMNAEGWVLTAEYSSGVVGLESLSYGVVRLESLTYGAAALGGQAPFGVPFKGRRGKVEL